MSTAVLFVRRSSEQKFGVGGWMLGRNANDVNQVVVLALSRCDVNKRPAARRRLPPWTSVRDPAKKSPMINICFGNIDYPE